MDKNILISTMREKLNAVKKEREDTKLNPVLLNAKTTLKNYQVERLKIDHFDLLNNYKTKGAAEFFLKEIYSMKDLTQRDKDVEKLIPIMETAFPLNALEVITEAVVLDSLTESLDSKMALALGSAFTEEQYLKAFREVTLREDREKQIDLVESLGKSLAQLVRIPLLATTLKMMRIPAKLAGVYNLHEFLETGFTVFKNTGDPEKFVNTLVSRERALLKEIYEAPSVINIANNSPNKPF